MLQSNGHYRSVPMPSRRGPQWATPQEMLDLIPEMQQAMRAEQYPGNWLSDQYRNEKVKRRGRNPMKEYNGLGRPPQYEYNVASVRRRVKELLSR
jgi:hypothetical protein